MLLNLDNICYYLLERRMISEKSFLDGDFMAVSVPTRNNIFKILSLNGPQLFMKQVSTFDAHALSILQREAAAYRFIKAHSAYAKLAGCIPDLIDYDKNRHVLTISYLSGYSSVHEYYFRQQKIQAAFSEKQAEIMASFHFPLPEGADVSAFPRQLPWILQLNDHAANQYFPQQDANQDLISMIQNHAELRRMLLELKTEWQFNSFIHGDMKWTNFIIPSNAAEAHDMKLVDWEIADVGDYCWDVAGLLQSFLTSWIFGFDNANTRQHQLQQNMKAFDIELTQPAIGKLWQAYSRYRGFTRAQEQEALMKTIRYAAARMLQTSIEGVVQTPQVYPNNVRIVQVAFNILRSPAEAATELFGIGTQTGSL